MPRPSILLIDMDVQVSVAMELFLRGRGFRVRVVSTPADAMGHASAEPADVVIIGNLLDSTDAGTVALRLRAVQGTHPTRVVVLSHGIEDVPGVDLVIPIGAHPRAILDALRTVARRQSITRPIVLEETG